MKLLFVQPNGIGNTILSTPAMQAIRAVFPKARFDLLINPLAFPLVEGWPVFDSIMTNQALVDAKEYDTVVLAEPQDQTQFRPVTAGAAGVLVHPNSRYRTRMLRRPLKHEVCVNMDLAVALGYKGAVPPLHANTAPDGADFDAYRGRIALHRRCNDRPGREEEVD